MVKHEKTKKNNYKNVIKHGLKMLEFISNVFAYVDCKSVCCVACISRMVSVVKCWDFETKHPINCLLSRYCRSKWYIMN